MSVLQKIREKTYLVLIFVGLGIGLFVLDPSSFFGNKRGDTFVGIIAGEKVEGQDFELKVQEALDNYKANYQSANIDEATKEAIRNQTWEQQIQEIVLGGQHEKLGITVSSEELFDMVQGPNPSQQVRQAFGNPQTGEFNPGNVIAFLKRMEEDESGDTKKRWLAFEKDLKKQQVFTKYNTLVKKGLYVTTAEAKSDNVAKNKMANIRFVAKRYAALTDTNITVTDAEVKTWYAANNYKEEYKQEKAVDLKYVTFDIKPSDEDNQEAKKWIDKTTEEFKLTSNDTLFININSDNKYKPLWLAENALPAAIDTLKKAAPGTIAGPYLDGESWKVSKLTGSKMACDSVKARHILLKVEGGNNEQVKATADSLKKVIKQKNNFAELAKVLSTDAGSGAQGGDLGWFKENVMVAPFNDACFNGKKGDMTIVESQFGIHLIEIMDKGKESRRLSIATVERKTEPSDKTFQTIYAKASDFSHKNRTLEAFDAAAAEAGYNVRLAPNIKPMDAKIAGLDNPRVVIMWAFNTAKKGDVAEEVYEIGDKYVVAAVSEKYEKGFKPLESIKEEVQAEAKKDKKAEKIIAEIEAALAAKPSAEDLANKLNTPLETAQMVVFNASSVPGMGKEPAVVGVVAALKAGQVSKPIKGLSGVYVVYVDNVTEAPEVTDFTPSKKQLEQALWGRADYEVYEALKDNADVVDNRVKFY